jgi:hypothetical protein
MAHSKISQREFKNMRAAVEEEMHEYRTDDNGPDQHYCVFCGAQVSLRKNEIPDIRHKSTCQGVALLAFLDSHIED